MANLFLSFHSLSNFTTPYVALHILAYADIECVEIEERMMKTAMMIMLSMVVATGAMAAGMNNGPQQTLRQAPAFAQFDQDGNGQVTEQEFNAVRSARIKQRSEQGRMMKNVANAVSFATLDANKDGVLTVQELGRHPFSQSQQSERGMHKGVRGGRI